MQREHAAFREQLESKAKAALEISFLDPRLGLAEDIGRLLKGMGAEFAPEHVRVDFDARTGKLAAQVWYTRRHGSLLLANPQQFYAKVSAGDGAGRPTATGPLELTGASFPREVLAARMPVLVTFWAPWCGYCQQALPSIDEASRRFAGKMVMAKLNVDDHREMASQYGIRGLPTFMFFKQGKAVASHPGWPGHDGLIRMIQGHL
jgi:thioredoxin 1